MDEVVIERVVASTVSEVLPLLAVQLAEHDIALGASALEAAVCGLVEVSGRGAVLAARDRSGAVVGAAVLAYTWTLEHGGKCTWLDELYVIPERRNAGVGLLLLHSGMEIARADGCVAMDLEVDNDHARVQLLYLREGFAALPRRRFARKL